MRDKSNTNQIKGKITNEDVLEDVPKEVTDSLNEKKACGTDENHKEGDIEDINEENENSVENEEENKKLNQNEEEIILSLKEKVDELKKDLKKKEDEASEYLSLAQRLKAEFENYRKRTDKEKNELMYLGQEKIILKVLPVIDNFERALNNNGDDKSLKEGVELIYKQFKDILEKTGVREIRALGEIFDPYKHHAVMQEQSKGKKENEIIEVLQKGYTFNDKVIRPSMVKVAK